MKIIGSISNAPDFIKGETVWLKSDEKRSCPMSVEKTFYDHDACAWKVTLIWVDKANNMCEDDFSPFLLAKRDRYTRREVVFVPDWD